MAYIPKYKKSKKQGFWVGFNSFIGRAKKNYFMVFLWGLVLGLLLQGSAILTNLEQLPSSAIKLSNSFLSWYYEDVLWNGFWTEYTYSDESEDLNLTATNINLNLDVNQGHIFGQIIAPKICEVTPLLGFYKVEGKVDLIRSEAQLAAFDSIGGKRVYFFTFRVKRNGDIMEVTPLHDPLSYLVAPIRIAKSFEDEGLEEEFSDLCSKHREKFFEELHKKTGLSKHVRKKLPTLE